MKKKKIMKVLFILLAILTFGIITACNGGNGPLDPGMMTYYGCPNSKRVVKLNTRKH